MLGRSCRAAHLAKMPRFEHASIFFTKPRQWEESEDGTLQASQLGSEENESLFFERGMNQFLHSGNAKRADVDRMREALKVAVPPNAALGPVKSRRVAFVLPMYPWSTTFLPPEPLPPHANSALEFRSRAQHLRQMFYVLKLKATRFTAMRGRNSSRGGLLARQFESRATSPYAVLSETGPLQV